MKEIGFVDTTLRDGHQSLWATRMSTAMMFPVASLIDEAGYDVVELLGQVQADTCVRYLRENPWERLRIMAKAMPKTPLRVAIRGKSLTGFGIFPDSVVNLYIKRYVANGARSLTIFDFLHNLDTFSQFIPVAKAEGLEVVVMMGYMVSPVHTDEHYQRYACEIANRTSADCIVLEDPMGTLTPERTRTLMPALLSAGLPVELHAHCTIGLAPLVYLEAIQLGVTRLHTCASPLANGSSLPSIENIIRNARRLGYTSFIDEKKIEAISDHFRYGAKREGKPLGMVAEYDNFQFIHQVPGGMISNFKFMLSQRGMEHRLDEVLEEVGKVCKEFGYPIMGTPYSQIVGTQAVLNVLSGERYNVVPNETIMYMLGHYGKPPGPIDQNVKDKVLSLPEAKKFLKWELPQPSIGELRQQYGYPGISDDELLLRILFPQEHVDATLAAGSIKTSYPRGDKPIMALIQELLTKKRERTFYIHIQKGDFLLSLEKARKNNVYVSASAKNCSKDRDFWQGEVV